MGEVQVGVFCAVCCTKVYDFLFHCKTITSTLYLDTPENLMIQQITAECNPHRNMVLQQDGALPHFHSNVKFLGSQIPRSVERACCASYLVSSLTGLDANGRFPFGSN